MLFRLNVNEKSKTSCYQNCNFVLSTELKNMIRSKIDRLVLIHLQPSQVMSTTSLRQLL